MPALDLAQAFARQLAHPRGFAGRLLGGAMDVVNRTPTSRAIDLLVPEPGERILDAGCGSGAAMRELLRRAPCHVEGVDQSEAMLAFAARRLGADARLHQTSIENMRFAPASFDAILALNVLYFGNANGHMTASLRQLLRPGGRLIVYVTHRQTMERWPFASKGLHRLFDETRLADELTAGGFARDAIGVHSECVAPSVMGIFAQARR